MSSDSPRTDGRQSVTALPTRIQYAHGGGRFYRGTHLLADYFDRETGDLIERAFEAEASPAASEDAPLTRTFADAIRAGWHAPDQCPAASGDALREALHANGIGCPVRCRPFSDGGGQYVVCGGPDDHAWQAAALAASPPLPEGLDDHSGPSHDFIHCRRCNGEQERMAQQPDSREGADPFDMGPGMAPGVDA